MAEKAGVNWQKWGLILGGIFVIMLAIAAVLFIFFLPSFWEMNPETGEPLVPELPEIVMRFGTIIGVAIVGLVFLAGIIYLIYDLFFKKRELHIVKEHHKIITEAAALNPVDNLGRLVLTGSGKIQSYSIGKIVGHTQIPINFERQIFVKPTGEINEKTSEPIPDFKKRQIAAAKSGKDKYDFFAFITRKGIYSLPFFSLLEPPKIFACYPNERSPDLVGDIEIYDVGTWKVSAVNLFVPGQRHREPMGTIKEIEGQLLPIAYISLTDYVGLVAQRGIEGDTSMQKWLQAKASQVNIKEGSE